MTEKRQYPRYSCKLKTKFEFYEGDPDKIDMDISVPSKGKGFILDIGKGGVFIVTNERVTINVPIKIHFSIKSKKFYEEGTIIRTGLLQNNPSEVAQRFAKFSVKGETYIAVKFKNPIEFSGKEL